jgi:hypothetical protein
MSAISPENTATVLTTSVTPPATKRKRSTQKTPGKKERKCIADGKEYLTFTADFQVHKPVSEEQKKQQQQLELKGM